MNHYFGPLLNLSFSFATPFLNPFWTFFLRFWTQTEPLFYSFLISSIPFFHPSPNLSFSFSTPFLYPFRTSFTLLNPFRTSLTLLNPYWTLFWTRAIFTDGSCGKCWWVSSLPFMLLLSSPFSMLLLYYFFLYFSFIFFLFLFFFCFFLSLILLSLSFLTLAWRKKVRWRRGERKRK